MVQFIILNKAVLSISFEVDVPLGKQAAAYFSSAECASYLGGLGACPLENFEI